MAIVKKYKVEVVAIENKIQGVYTLELKSLSGKFKYLPGQFLHLALDEYDPSGAWPDSRCFSVQTSPTEENLKITYSAKGEFTHKMASSIYVGRQMDIKLPFGEIFQQTHSKGNVVFIAGGTGVTPFLSLFTDPSFSQYLNPKLYFGIRNEAFHLYEREFNCAKAINPSLTIDVVNEQLDGILNIEKIFKGNGTGSVYFVSGPPKMISLFKNSLIEFGVEGHLVLTDDWE